MATKTTVEHFCDACGEKYDPHNIMKWPINLRVTCNYDSWDGTEHSPEQRTKYYELCPKCGGKVLDMLNGMCEKKK